MITLLHATARLIQDLGLLLGLTSTALYSFAGRCRRRAYQIERDAS